MRSQVCVDANFALELVLAEEGSEAVQALWTAWSAQDVETIAPCHLIFEATSVIRNHVYRSLISAEARQAAFDAFWHRRSPCYILIPSTTEPGVSEQYNRPTAYDASYLSLAESAGCELWTADDRLYKAVRDALPWVKPLRANAS